MLDLADAKECITESESIWDERHRQQDRYLKSYYGDQWSDKDKAIATELKMPQLTVNIQQGSVKIVSGVMWQNQLEARAVPIDANDEKKAEIASKVLKYIEQKNRMPIKDSAVFNTGLICDIGCYSVERDYSYDKIEGKIIIKAERPQNLFPDPNFEEYDLSDCAYFIRRKFLTEDTIKSFFPDADIDFKLMAASHYDNVLKGDLGDSDKAIRYPVHEVYYREYTSQKFLLDKQTADLHLMIKKDGVDYVKYRGEEMELDFLVTENPDNYKEIRKRAPRISLTTVCLDDTLQKPGWGPFDDSQHTQQTYPFFLYMPNFLYGKSQGIVAPTMDIQREKNVRRSQILHNINQTSNTGWFYKDGAVDPKLLKQFGSSYNAVIKIGDDSEWKKDVGRIEPGQVSPYIFQMEKEAENDLRSITNINTEFLGQGGKSESGRAIALKQQAALTSVQNEIEAFVETRTNLFNFVFKVAQTTFKSRKIIRISGDEDAVILNDKIVDKESGEALTINSIADNEYDIVIEQTPASVTFRQSNFENLKEMFEQFGPQVIPPSEIIANSSIPGA